MSSTPQVVEDVMRYNTRYKSDSAGLLSILLLSVLALIFALGLLILVQISTHPSPQIFPLNEQSQLIPTAPLNEEGISKAALFNWVNSFILDAFSYNYSNQSKQAFKLSPYLSQTAMKIYLDLLANDQDFNTVSQKKAVVSIKLTSTPELGDGREFRGRYAWQIKVPFTIEFSNAVYKYGQQATMIILVWRVPIDESPLGISIATFSYSVDSRIGREAVNTGF